MGKLPEQQSSREEQESLLKILNNLSHSKSKGPKERKNKQKTRKEKHEGKLPWRMK